MEAKRAERAAKKVRKEDERRQRFLESLPKILWVKELDRDTLMKSAEELGRKTMTNGQIRIGRRQR
jgi:hypothetical protein